MSVTIPSARPPQARAPLPTPSSSPERYFDPDRGVWTQEDPIVQHNAYGTYSYANSDPVNNVDPSGAVSIKGVARAVLGTAGKVYARAAFPVCVLRTVITPVRCQGAGCRFGPNFRNTISTFWDCTWIFG